MQKASPNAMCLNDVNGAIYKDGRDFQSQERHLDALIPLKVNSIQESNKSSHFPLF